MTCVQKYFFFLAGFLVVIGTGCDSTAIVPNDEQETHDDRDILEKLEGLRNTFVRELPTQDHFDRLFEIRILQPIDHNEGDNRLFTQKLYLGHVDSDLPVIFETEGYSRDRHQTRELADRLQANQLTVEHRFYGSSVPDTRDWSDLNIWQAANDHHLIVQLFKAIYPGAWISSGVSKGGDTAIFHRRFFPNDVDGTVAYVAPILFEKEDQRFVDDFSMRGSAECRSRMEAYQRTILERVDDMDVYFDDHVRSTNKYFGIGLTFSLPYKNIIYHAIREDYAFEFWSSETEDCSTIPGPDASDRQLFSHFAEVFDVFLFFSDWGVYFWTPYAYQALTELGNYRAKKDHLDDLVMDIPELVNFDVATDFDPAPMADIANWLVSEAEDMIFIYGENDPWTIADVDIRDHPTMFKFVAEGTKHQTRIGDLTGSEIEQVDALVAEWIGR